MQKIDNYRRLLNAFSDLRRVGAIAAYVYPKPVMLDVTWRLRRHLFTRDGDLGYAFTTRDRVKLLRRGLNCRIDFGPIDPPSDAKVKPVTESIGRRVALYIRAHGLSYVWNGNYDDPIWVLGEFDGYTRDGS